MALSLYKHHFDIEGKFELENRWLAYQVRFGAKPGQKRKNNAGVVEVDLTARSTEGKTQET